MSLHNKPKPAEHFMPFEPIELLKNSPLAIIISDKSERILWCNGLFLEQTLLSESSVIGHLYASLPIEAIDRNAQIIQLFSNNHGDEIKFQYWQENYSSPAGAKIHYFIRERENRNELQSLSGKLKNFRLPKKNNWVEFLDYEVSRSRRYDNPLSILKLHILIRNNPESVNPEIIQRNIKETLTDELRWADMVGHTDQGSYLIVLPETPADSVSALQVKLDKSVKRQLTMVSKNLDYQLVFADACWRKHDDSGLLLERARSNLVNKLEKLLSDMDS